MISFLLDFLGCLSALFRSRYNLGLEILALHQQLGILKRKIPRPRLQLQDRVFWILLRVYGGHGATPWLLSNQKPLSPGIGLAFGIDPLHLGIIFLANLELGYLTPPVGMNLFLASYRFSKPLSEVYRSILPILLVFLVGVLCITYVPWLTTALPRVLGR